MMKPDSQALYKYKLFQLDDEPCPLHRKWLEISKHPFKKNGGLEFQALTTISSTWLSSPCNRNRALYLKLELQRCKSSRQRSNPGDQGNPVFLFRDASGEPGYTSWPTDFFKQMFFSNSFIYLPWKLFFDKHKIPGASEIYQKKIRPSRGFYLVFSCRGFFLGGNQIHMSHFIQTKI